MRKLLFLSFHSFIIFVSTFLLSCSNTTSSVDFYPKSYDEYYTALENTTIEMELVINKHRAICTYTNDSVLFVYSIKYQYSNEYGYIYDTKNNELYAIENHKITEKILNAEAEQKISELYSSNNVLFHLKFDYSQFEYINTVTVCNRECDKYRFTDEINGEEATYNVYIDKQTGLCLKGVCIINDSTIMYFETKNFVKEPSTIDYKQVLNSFNNKKSTQ